MMIPRLNAIIFTFLIIGVVAFAAIKLVGWIGPAAVHGQAARHDDGTIVKIDPAGTVFSLESSESGKTVQYQCTVRCRSQIQHIHRHITEKAHTDVYYIQQGTQTLLAIDVD